MEAIEVLAQRARELTTAYSRVRLRTIALVDGLTPEDCMVQSMPEASPVKWHLAHVTWFFETLVLQRFVPLSGRQFRPFRPEFAVLFNSYYVGLGAFHPRSDRGVLSRPSLDEVLAYRRSIDEQTLALLGSSAVSADMLDVVELGLQHEQQHQELILTDLKHHFSRNPLLPAYREPPATTGRAALPALRFVDFCGGRTDIGHAPPGFAFDNERPRHAVWLQGFSMASRLVSNGEFRRFIDDRGYDRPDLWLSDGWDAARREGWKSPLYWNADGTLFTLTGRRQIDPDEPVCHLSYYEADAYARWAGARLASEAEWEHAAQLTLARQRGDRISPGSIDGNFAERGALHPVAASAAHGNPETPDGIAQLFGDAWEWTQSAYLPYPGFKPAEGPASEYNGKFMINQMVLRGGSCATPCGHLRPSYRNFFHPWARWQFSGIRLVRDPG